MTTTARRDPRSRVNHQARWRTRDRWWAAFFLAPQALGILLFSIVPFAFSFYLAFHRWTGFGEMTYIGLDGFRQELTDPLFGRAVLNTLAISGVTVPAGLLLAIWVAVQLNRIGRRTVYLVMFFAPVVTSSVAVALIWQQLLRGDGWVSTTIGRLLHIGAPDWLNDPHLALLAVCLVTIWSSLGLNVVIFLAGLQNINPSVLEAASIDGAGRRRTFWSVTMPMLSPTVFFQSVIAFISSLQTFDLVFVLVKNAGPDNATRTIVFHIYDLGFRQSQLGLSAVAAVFLLALSALITALQFGLEKRFVHYDS